MREKKKKRENKFLKVKDIIIILNSFGHDNREVKIGYYVAVFFPEFDPEQRAVNF